MIDRPELATAIDAILVLVALEAIGLLVWRWATQRGPAPRAVLAMLAAGFFLMLATRLALGAAAAPAIAACLIAALVAHLGDLAMRWPAGASSQSQAPKTTNPARSGPENRPAGDRPPR